MAELVFNPEVEALSGKLMQLGGFASPNPFTFLDSTECEVCLERHDLLVLMIGICQGDVRTMPGGLVRLSDGSIDVHLTQSLPCIPQPFQNTAKQLSRYLKLPIVSDHQVFDSIDHLVQSLKFTVPGEFFGWDETVLSFSEEYEIETGHLAKFNFQPEGESVLLDVVVEFQAVRDFESNYKGTKARRYGVEITLSGGTPEHLGNAQVLLQSALDDYARILSTSII